LSAKVSLDKAREAMQAPQDEYHLQELVIGLDPDNPAHSLPAFQKGERVLDIGCGAAQTLIAACPYRLPGEGGGCVTCTRTDNACQGWASGVDVDEGAVRLGRAWSRILQLQHASAEHLPYSDQEFDVVVSRVALVFVDMRTVLTEVRRVLRPGGRIWFTLHRFSMVTHQIRCKNWRGLIYLAYVILNGVYFHLTLRTLPLLDRREYWQPPSAMRRILAKYGFEDIQIETRREGLTVSATLTSGS
jgi:ubiquinone/menaquinone biosynthesis C-methylase UbiE